MNKKSLIDKSTGKLSAKMVPEEIAKSENIKDSLSLIREDCPDKPTAPIDRLIQKELRLCSEKLGLDNEEMQAWITLQTGAPAKSILHALRTARQYALDPLQEEVLITKYDKGWQVSVSADGWMKIINGHPVFTGLTFTQSPEENEGLPLWMECTIHRSDRAIPIAVREYMNEMRTESEVWRKMPRRMLRHRALQQCAKIAFGIGLRDACKDSLEAINVPIKHVQPVTLKTQNETSFSQIKKLKTILN
jgi:hypothetical protein